ncbi:hypothetical protein [Phormidesmis priestleyi]|uniref:hypothetical protein n=1 Tax=Phormidesmis priestleyi TaxID=268141 RepID=UPI000A969FC9|nr:hypothetical protein [Phormidesmis priestleyi]
MRVSRTQCETTIGLDEKAKRGAIVFNAIAPRFVLSLRECLRVFEVYFTSMLLHP